MRIETAVPRHHLESLALCALCQSLQFFLLLASRGHVCVDEVVEQFIYVACVARHAALQHIVGVGLKAKQLCHFTSKVHQPLAYLEVVLAIVVDTYRISRHVKFLAQFAASAVCHERTVTGVVESKHPSLQVTFLCRHCRRLACCLWQPVKVLLVGYVKRESLVLLQQVLRELKREHRRLLGEFAQLVFPFLVEQGTRAHKSLITVLQQLFLFWCKLAVMAMNIFHPLKQFLVKSHVVGVLGEHRLHLLSKRIHLVVCLGAEEIEEHRAHASQQTIIVFVVILVENGVVEGWLLRVVYYLVQLFVVAANAFHEGLFIVFKPYFIERCCLMRGVIFLEERVYASFLYCFSLADVFLTLLYAVLVHNHISCVAL